MFSSFMSRVQEVFINLLYKIHWHIRDTGLFRYDVSFFITVSGMKLTLYRLYAMRLASAYYVVMGMAVIGLVSDYSHGLSPGDPFPPRPTGRDGHLLLAHLLPVPVKQAD